MASKPEIGREGGQQYPIVKSIQTFLEQMAEGGALPASAVLKELLQNADDAGATEVAVFLDERIPPAVFSDQYKELCCPAIIVRNNAPFRIGTEVPEGAQDDFTAIRDVASGHKRADNTAAGRFGIGFNSVYFLTDTPIIFSRREINVFDLLHRVIESNGWIFNLNDFPASSKSSAGEIKSVLEWCLPKDALQTTTIGETAFEGDYKQAAFRLPFRTKSENREYLFRDSFPKPDRRKKVLEEMVDEAKRSILFLKSVRTITFSTIDAAGCEAISKTEVTPNAPEFDTVLKAIKEKKRLDNSVHFERIISCSNGKDTQHFRFHVWHAIYSEEENVEKLRKLLELSDRAVPWVSIAVPLDRESSQIDGKDGTRWRVFLPLLEVGPSICLFSGAFFVGPSRQRMEFRFDEGILKTEWNKALVKHGLIDLFCNITLDLPTIASDLLEADPKCYLSLFPLKPSGDSSLTLTDYFKECFSKVPWVLCIKDIWGETLQVMAGDHSALMMLNMIPEWLTLYKGCYKDLTNAGRRFVAYTLGDALRERLLEGSSIVVIREVPLDVAESVLKAPVPPKAEALNKALDILLRAEDAPEILEGAWAFVDSTEGSAIPYSSKTLYIIDIQKDRDPIIDHIRKLPLPLESVEWVKEDGLAKKRKQAESRFENIMLPDAKAAIELLRRLPQENMHDVLEQSPQIVPIVDFLVQQKSIHLIDMKLGFLVRTATHKRSRHDLGVIFLKASQFTRENEAFWETWFRKLFAEVDPGFAKEIMRLLDKHPNCLEMLHSDDCQVIHARPDIALDVLNRSLKKRPGLIDELKEKINDKRSTSEGFSDRISQSLIEYADSRWEDMDDSQKHTLVRLPIHRTAEGKFVSLIGDPEDGTEEYQDHFRLQTEDDLKDAPIEFGSYVLLNWRDRSTKNFYRNRLRIEVHGRISVLKDVLRQIGKADDQVRNDKLLTYLLMYYGQCVDELRDSKDQIDADDSDHLKKLLVDAHFVPCIDCGWHTTEESCLVTRVQEKLLQQKWPEKDISRLIQYLFDDDCIVRLSDSEDINHFAKKNGIELKEIDPSRLYQQAISSNSTNLLLKDRAQLINYNIPDSPDIEIEPSPTLRTMPIPTLMGNKALEQTTFFDACSLTLAPMKIILPDAVDKKAFAQEVTVPEKRAVAVLAAMGVRKILPKEVAENVVKEFRYLWQGCQAKGDRFSIISFLRANRLDGEMKRLASSLDTVLVEAKKETWKEPVSVFSPSLMLTEPPLLIEDEMPNSLAPDEVKEVWKEWCGVGTIGEALQVLVEKVKSQKNIQKAARDLYGWIDRVYPSSEPELDEFEDALRITSWVLARQDGREELAVPGDVIIHKGNDVLQKCFWVPAVSLPVKTRDREDEIGFTTELEASQDNLEAVCKCLSQQSQRDTSALLSIYEYVAGIIEEDPALHKRWNDLAEKNKVFSTFRSDHNHVSSLQLFVGEPEAEDLSPNLLCLGTNESISKKAEKLYQELGIPKEPTLKQVLHALIVFDQKDKVNAYKNLVDALVKLGAEAPVDCDWENIKVKTCDGSFQRLGESYWDSTLGYKSRVQQPAAYKLIDTQNNDVKRLLYWMHERENSYPKCLRNKCGLFITGDKKPAPHVNSLDYILEPWRQLCSEIMRADSNANEEVSKRGLQIPLRPIEFRVVERIILHAETLDSTTIEQAPKWEGSVAFADKDGCLFISAANLYKTVSLDASKIKDIDIAISEEVLHCLGDVSFYKPTIDSAQCLIGLLERPSTVLQNLKERNKSHFIYQYQDQVADPEFTTIFDEYVKTKPSSFRHHQLEEQLYEIMSCKFVEARREQIRGYGYDEFSVVTELLQNAEDAYSQREWLGMEMPETCEVEFLYERESDGTTVLSVVHEGRPFNYCRHGGKENRAFARDVEGVLRSAGSYKPHSLRSDSEEAETIANIGRFGLGFKSVFLLSDRPEINSGHWHFAVENGCMPAEIPTPDGWNPSLTKIKLPLNANAEKRLDVNRLAQLLPFLRKIEKLRVTDTNGNQDIVVLKEKTIIEDQDWSTRDCIIEINERPLCRFVKVRSGSSQLAMLVDTKHIPAKWDEFSDNDLYAFLPLKSRLGCGIGISHQFHVQSGRTHLTSSEENKQFAQDVAGILFGLTKTLNKDSFAPDERGVSARLMRFWQLWEWNQHDAECEFIVDELAKELWRIANNEDVVPTYNSDTAVSLKDGSYFYFADLPGAFRQVLMGNGFAVLAGQDEEIELSDTNVVPEGFVSSLRRLAEYTGHQLDDNLFRVGWEQIEQACKRRPWFAEKPDLLNELASCLSEERRDDVARWLVDCRIAGVDEIGEAVDDLPIELFSRSIAEPGYLPTRLLRYVDDVYTKPATELLKKAGLKARPSTEDISHWITSGGLNDEECIGLLRYLAIQDRFRSYWNLQKLLCSAWIQNKDSKITPKEAKEKGLLPQEVIANKVFEAWLGVEIGEGPNQISPLTQYDTESVLKKLADWWVKHSSEEIHCYHRRVYPNGQPPILRLSDGVMTTSERREWMILLMLGSLHTMGRAKPEQHRDFIMRRSKDGLLDVISEQSDDNRRWFDFIESFLDDPLGNQDYYQWMRQFIAFYQFNKWLLGYVSVFTSIDRFDRPLTINDIFNPRENPDFSGGGPDVPAMKRALGNIGPHFVLRELVRLGFVKGKNITHQCYVPAGRVRYLLSKITNGDMFQSSEDIYRLLISVLGKDNATFGNAFDLPLIALAHNKELQLDIIGEDVDFMTGND